MRRAVKCRGGFWRAALLATLFLASPSHPQLLLGQGPNVPRPPPTLDPRLPRGAAQVFDERPTTPAVCSFKYPVCFHAAPTKLKENQMLEWVGALESAYERLVVLLGLPAPLDDVNHGGGPNFDVYFVPGAHGVHASPDAVDEAAAHDSASAFCVVGDDALPIARAATLCLGEAIAFELDASETPFSRRALATELWLTTGTPTSADARAIDDVQASPERAIVARDASSRAEGGALLLEYLDRAKGRGAPAEVGLATYALSAGKRSPAGLRWVNEPDTLDVLRATFGPTPSDVARLFADFAVDRAFLGSRDSQGLWPSLRWVGDFGRVRFEWSVRISSFPRRLAPARPVEPTGSTYLWVTLDEPPPVQGFGFEADWEPPAAFRWALVAVDARGVPLRRIDVPFLERETHVERIIGDLTGAAGVLIAGTNLGGLGPSYPFDPDFEPYEPHAYTVYLAMP